MIGADLARFVADGESFAELPPVLVGLLSPGSVGEENCELALKILGSEHYAARRGGPLREVMDRLTTYCISVVASSNDMIEQVRRPEDPQNHEIN